MKWTVPRMWEGQTVAVLASGPSLTPALAQRLRVHRTIAVNHAHRLAPWADMLLALDGGWPDELRQFASETFRLVKREAAIKARVSPIVPPPFRRTTAELEAAVEMVIRRWPGVGITEISMSTGIMDGRIRKTQAWQRHSAAKEGG